MSRFTLRRVVAGIFLSLIAVMAIFIAANAQDDSNCEMSGYVLDPHGRGVPSAEVVLKVGGRTSASRVVSDLDGSYRIQLPRLILEETGYMYVRIPGGEVVVNGHINFKRCRTRRDVFTSEPPSVGYQPGPTPPVPPPVVPAYPGPDAPLPSLANAVAFFDLTALTRGGVIPGDRFVLPICVAAFSSPLPQISKLTFIAEFDPSRVSVSAPQPVTTGPFNQTPRRSTVERPTVGGRERGRIWYEVETPTLVELPEVPRPCLPVATVEMVARSVRGDITVRPGDTVGFSTVKGLDTNPVREVNTSMRIGTIEGPIARSTTYLDILTPQEQEDILKRTFLPVLIKNAKLR